MFLNPSKRAVSAVGAGGFKHSILANPSNTEAWLPIPGATRVCAEPIHKTLPDQLDMMECIFVTASAVLKAAEAAIKMHSVALVYISPMFFACSLNDFNCVLINST
jgi:hypothetical protein